MIKRKQIFLNPSRVHDLNIPNPEAEEKVSSLNKNRKILQYRYKMTNTIMKILTIITTIKIIEVSLEDVDLTEAKIQVNFSEVKVHVAEANATKMHTKANIKTMGTKAIEVHTTTHAEISNRVIIMANLEAEAMVMAEEITMAMVTAGLIIKIMLTTNIISIMVMMMSTRQINTVHHVHYVVAPKHCFKGEHDINDIKEKMNISRHQVVYIPKGEHDDPHELPQQQELEGSTEIEHTLLFTY